MNAFHRYTLPLDSRQLRAFVALVHAGSFTRAAKELSLSQSAVSHSMRVLEEDVGCRLLDRLGKKVLLTQAGEQFLHHAQKILEEMQAARTSLEQMGKWAKGRLRIAAAISICQYVLPTVIRELKNTFPDCLVNIHPADTSKALEMIHNGEIDLAFVLAPEKSGEHEFLPIFSDELQFVIHPEHPWAEKRNVIRDDIPKQQYIFYHKNSYTFRMVEGYFRECGIVLNRVIELGSMDAIKELVKLDIGISVVAPWIVENELRQRTLLTLPLGKRRLKRTWGIAYSKTRPLNFPEETFVRLCRNATTRFISQTL